MGEQIRAEKRIEERATVDEAVAASVGTVATEGAEKIKEETDALLDEIDQLLEENADEFVKTYVQKGGQ